MPIRIIVAGGSAYWRLQACLVLRLQPELRVIEETTNGMKAVQKTCALRPDLILLDTHLAGLSGMEAVKQIKNLCPACKVIVLGHDNSADGVQAALSAGANGYLYKPHAYTQLLAAVETVLRNEIFVARGRDEDEPGKGSHRHEIQFYSNHSILLDSFARFMNTALKSGGSTILVVNETYRNNILQMLKARAFNIYDFIVRRRSMHLDPVDLAAEVMVSGIPDPNRFSKVVGDLIYAAVGTAQAPHPHVSVCVDLTGHLIAKHDLQSAVRFEELWDRLAKTHSINILCAYPFASFREEDESFFRAICSKHSAVHSD